MKFFISLLSVFVLIGFTSCKENVKKNTEKSMPTVTINIETRGVVQEAIQTSNYTYCLVKGDSAENWIATSKLDVKKGQVLYFKKGLEMKNFHSKELDRTFPVVFFVQEASTDSTSVLFNPKQMPPQHMKPEAVKKDIVIKRTDGSISIAELYANKTKYAGKIIKIRGKVTRYNSGIMGKNWAHIQDGTGNDGNFDLTVTTLDQVQLGEVVTFEGTITLDKNFGSGYSYAVLMEDAKLIK